MKIDNMNKRVILDWSRVRGARGYNIYRKEGGTDSYIKLGTVKSKSSEFKDDLSNQENKLFFYKVRSLSALYTESTDSDIAIGFINGPTYAPRTIFIPGQGLKNFIGRWHATYWDIKNKPLDFVLQIGRIGRDEFVVQTIFRGKKHRVKGKYASGSRYLTTKNFEFQLIEEFKNDVAHVVFQSGIIAKNKIVLDFVRQGSQ